MKPSTDTSGKHAIVIAMAQRFLPAAQVTVTSLGAGLINDSFLVHAIIDGQQRRAVLQRINHRVFNEPAQLMANMEKVLTRFHNATAPSGLVMPTLYRADDGLTYCRDSEGGYWRMTSYIDNATSIDTLQSSQQARRVGIALGCFHATLADMDVSALFDTLPGFHVTPRYLESYDAAAAGFAPASDAEGSCAAMIEEGRAAAGVLQQALASGVLRLRVMHGDPKMNNFLFSADGDTVLSLIDLDTVKPGLYHYDIADCIRSACNPAGEDPARPGVEFNMTYCQSLLQGYMSMCGHGFTQAEIDLLPAAISLMPYELGLRFFTDHLTGNQYFKTAYAGHNLDRALRQFSLWRQTRQQQEAIAQQLQKRAAWSAPLLDA